ncbi:MAG: hypothetical protein LUH57_00665 [Ruminococcus sp.]|nr:hypothetical protein [Ruminococcus sp.]
MPIIVHQIKCPIDESEQNAKAKALKLLGLKEKDVRDISLHKRSLDARKGYKTSFVYSFMICLADESREKAIAEKKKATLVRNEEFFPKCRLDKRSDIIIAGFGPAGMFAALTLARMGYKPIVLERGGSMNDRVKAVNSFWKGGALDSATNVQFGEGGAGTFSDGKLTTRIKDPLCRVVLNEFVTFGADKSILTQAKPHIGTDKIREIVVSLRREIERLGGKVLFNSPLDNITIKNGKVTSVWSNGREFKTDRLILAIGHSARDTFELLLEKGIVIEPKPFSIGARIEHRQTDVDKSLYGSLAGDKRLPKGEYQLSKRFSPLSATYTFCMCPGGYVVPSQSEEKTILTNGMSFSDRNGGNANSAVVVSVSQNDFGTAPLDGVKFARDIERRAYNLTGSYKAPCMSVKGLLQDDKTIKSSVKPSYSLDVCYTDFSKLFPSRIIRLMKEGLADFSKKMSCFSGGILTAPETRTSSPVRILRNSDMTAVGVKNLYPTGEGAGYAGGIMSAAVDGIKAAVMIMEDEN